MHLLTGGGHPRNRKQVAATTVVYTFIFMALSLFWVDIPGPSANGEMVADQGKTMYEIITDIHQETERRDLSGYFYALGNHGEEAIDTLLYFLDCEDPVKREFAAGQLGRIRDPKAVDPLISALQDENWRVINSSCNALAEIGDQRAVAPIIDLVRKLPPHDRSRYYSVLGRLHAKSAWPYLLKGLEDDRWYVRNAALDALCEINFEKARSHVYTALDDTDYRVKRKAVFILLDRKPEDGLVYLNRVVCDTDFETRFYARQAIKQIEKEYNH